ncbi:UNVERIFIED_CONTAM: hypothetical protein FKN15_071854 [Acipenser sinensis]
MQNGTGEPYCWYLMFGLKRETTLSFVHIPCIRKADTVWKLPLKEENGKETLKPDTIEVKVHGDNSIQTNEEDSKA